MYAGGGGGLGTPAAFSASAIANSYGTTVPASGDHSAAVASGWMWGSIVRSSV
jgi:hypothetical protein